MSRPLVLLVLMVVVTALLVAPSAQVARPLLPFASNAVDLESSDGDSDANAGTGDEPSSSRPSYVECQTSADCSEGHCCTLGGERYSLPMCRPLLQQGNACRFQGKPFNTTLYYPDGTTLDASVHWVICPCAQGLSCQRRSRSCQPHA